MEQRSWHQFKLEHRQELKDKETAYPPSESNEYVFFHLDVWMESNFKPNIPILRKLFYIVATNMHSS